LWHSLHEYLESTEKDKQVIDSLIEGSLDKCKIDASELNIKVPDLLLRQCEQEIHRVWYNFLPSIEALWLCKYVLYNYEIVNKALLLADPIQRCCTNIM